MTTWALKDGVLAVDSRETFKDDTLYDNVNKIYEDSEFVFTSAGTTGDIIKLQEWLYIGKPEDKAPKVKKIDGLLYSKKSKTFWRTDGAVFIIMDKDTIASGGSGWVWARAAMELGKSAKEAVEFAAKFNQPTGGPVRTYTFEKKKKSKKIAKR